MMPKGFKHSEETKIKIGLSGKGKGGKYIRTDKIKEKNKIGNLGRKHTEKTRDNMRIGQLNRIWSKEGKTLFSLSRSGDKSPRWKGGYKCLATKIRKSFKYRQWRSDIFSRDDYTCQKCNKRGGSLEAHHLKQFIEIIRENNIISIEEAFICEELWNINNGQTLCSKCHNITKHKIIN